ncbi:transaldolase [Actinospongicola halichondriae]|uniref:transaldolase n=1 Tax=Actinospongicola halichondriae TaxID=3236844 RepID=UPI003D3AB3F0
MTRLHDLHDAGQSPWLDNLRRGYLRSGELQAYVDRGVRGITSNPSIFQKAIADSDDYDEQFGTLLADGTSVEDAYWQMVTDDISEALAVLRPVHDSSGGIDGYVSVEVDPGLARDTSGTIAAARALDERIDEPNLFVKIPATAEGVPAIETMISEGRSINVTLIFSIPRYEAVMEAYLSGLETRLDTGHDDLSEIASVASFFISRVDTEVDNRLESIGTDEALALRGRAAVAQAQVAYQRFLATFSGPRWERLAAAGAKVQRPLWASTSTKNDAYPDTLYVDTLIGPDTVNTLPEATIEAFEAEGTVARTVDADVDGAVSVLEGLRAVGIDMADVAERLEVEGVAAFEKSFDDLLDTLQTKADHEG